MFGLFLGCDESSIGSESDEAPVELAAFGISIKNNGDGTISSSALGKTLMWEETASSNLVNFAGADTHCSNATTAGHTDWRLPKASELAMITDYATTAPAAYSEFKFPALYSGFTSSGDSQLNDNNNSLSATRLTGSTNGSIGNGLKTSNINVRCVRGNPVSFDLTDNGDGSVTITGVGLTFEQKTSVGDYASRNQAGAVSDCEALVHAGRDDWRLPTVVEMLAIYDTAQPRAFNPTFFPSVSSLVSGSTFWTATENAGVSGEYMIFDPVQGTLTPKAEASDSGFEFFFCVRG